ncbi:MAG: hypothetical protein KGL39_38905 [Patescibacteria group bacterium]|nr:hypothetical protein [Patescibacteria group bacterium]
MIKKLTRHRLKLVYPPKGCRAVRIESQKAKLRQQIAEAEKIFLKYSDAGDLMLQKMSALQLQLDLLDAPEKPVSSKPPAPDHFVNRPSRASIFQNYRDAVADWDTKKPA